VVYFGGFFAKLGYFAGFLCISINFPVRISEAAIGGAGTLYRIASVVNECWRAIHTGNRKAEGGETFSTGEAVGGPKSYDSTETVVLYIIYFTPFCVSVVQWNETFFVRFAK
jgi:hypothetical protein